MYEEEVLSVEQENANLRDTVRSLEERRKEARARIVVLETENRRLKQLVRSATSVRRGARLVS